MSFLRLLALTIFAVACGHPADEPGESAAQLGLVDGQLSEAKSKFISAGYDELYRQGRVCYEDCQTLALGSLPGVSATVGPATVAALPTEQECKGASCQTGVRISDSGWEAFLNLYATKLTERGLHVKGADGSLDLALMIEHATSGS